MTEDTANHNTATISPDFTRPLATEAGLVGELAGQAVIAHLATGSKSWPCAVVIRDAQGETLAGAVAASHDALVRGLPYRFRSAVKLALGEMVCRNESKS